MIRFERSMTFVRIFSSTGRRRETCRESSSAASFSTEWKLNVVRPNQRFDCLLHSRFTLNIGLTAALLHEQKVYPLLCSNRLAHSMFWSFMHTPLLPRITYRPSHRMHTFTFSALYFVEGVLFIGAVFTTSSEALCQWPPYEESKSGCIVYNTPWPTSKYPSTSNASRALAFCSLTVQPATTNANDVTTSQRRSRANPHRTCRRARSAHDPRVFATWSGWCQCGFVPP
ncbi:hypothetical protein K474DRAFT_876696 [Panus rudis PR-1116 ss-1]|nr:hypothetical protein K474DRAFT_876696 [Panus rudis PR-1116 ss-1]